MSAVKRNLNILFLCNEYPPGIGGGIGVFTRTLARKLVECGCSVSVIGYQRLNSPVIEDDFGVRVIRIPAVYYPGINPFINALNLGKQIGRLNDISPIDIIEGPENAFWALPSENLGVKIIRMHGGHHFFSTNLGRKPGLSRSWSEKLSFHNADCYCAVSHYVAEETRRLQRLGNVGIEILPNPVDTRLFSPRTDVLEEPGAIFFAGTVTEKKGIRQLVEAMPAIIRQVPEARLYVAGRDSIDPKTKASYIAGLRKLIPEHFKDKIKFLGVVPNEDLPTFIARAQICVYPSHMEAQGIVTIEGMSMGKCVVASKTGPGPEIIQHEQNGLLCDPYDPKSIAENVIRGLACASLRHSLGTAARRTVEQNYSIDVMLHRNIAFYQACLDNKI